MPFQKQDSTPDYPTMIEYLRERSLIITRITDHEFRDDPCDITAIYINGKWHDMNVSVDHVAGHQDLAKQIRTLCNYDYLNKSKI